ncbi:hypothetical protein RAS1_01450 [Phycisphaerae bacterium RAS1]|nr:hypothetical protein RAS1_01450 [Phycisphaerae bacterium RAS1]
MSTGSARRIVGFVAISTLGLGSAASAMFFVGGRTGGADRRSEAAQAAVADLAAWPGRDFSGLIEFDIERTTYSENAPQARHQHARVWIAGPDRIRLDLWLDDEITAPVVCAIDGDRGVWMVWRDDAILHRAPFPMPAGNAGMLNQMRMQLSQARGWAQLLTNPGVGEIDFSSPLSTTDSGARVSISQGNNVTLVAARPDDAPHYRPLFFASAAWGSSMVIGGYHVPAADVAIPRSLTFLRATRSREAAVERWEIRSVESLPPESGDFDGALAPPDRLSPDFPKVVAAAVYASDGRLSVATFRH